MPIKQTSEATHTSPSPAASPKAAPRHNIAITFLKFFVFVFLFIYPLISCGNENPPPEEFNLREFLDYEVFPLENAVWWEEECVYAYENGHPAPKTNFDMYEVVKINNNVAELFKTKYEKDTVTIASLPE